MKIRLTYRVLEHLDGSSLFQRLSTAGAYWYSNEPRLQAAADRLREKLVAEPARRDRSITVVLDEDELDVLRSYVEGMEIGGRDNAWDPDGRAEYNAARALLNRIGRRQWKLT